MKRLKIILTLSVILSVAAAYSCGGKQDTAGTGRGALVSLVPKTADTAGWNKTGENRTFTEGNLWEYINGAADAYLLYGFQEVVTADYTHESSGQDVVLDIYEMQDPLNAFGIYANERNPEYNFEKLGVEGYIGGTSVNFWFDKYYVKITAFEETGPIADDLRAFANAIVAKVSSTAGEPAELRYFPAANLQRNHMKYIPHDVLGQSYLYNGFEAVYRAGDSEYKMFLITLDTPEDAATALDKYKEFITGGGDVRKTIDSPFDGGFTGKDGFYGDMLTVRKGASIGVVLSMPSETAGLSLVAELLGHIQ